MRDARLAWIEAACDYNLSILPTRTRSFLDKSALASISSPIERFALASRCVFKALAPSPMAERAAWLKRHCLRPDAAEAEIESELLLPLADWFLNCRLDRWPHWAIGDALFDALRLAVLYLPAGDDAEDWLKNVWGLDDDEVEKVHKSALTLTLEGPPGFGDEHLTKTVEVLLETHGLQLEIPPYLEDVPPHMRWVSTVQLVDMRPNVPTVIRTLGVTIQQWLAKATLLELHLARTLDGARMLQPEDVASRWKTVHAEEGGTRKPSLWTSAGGTTPRWVIGRIVELGARSMHQLVGPVPYWFGTFDEPTVMPRTIGLVDPEQRGRKLHFVLIYDDGQESPAHIPWTYDLDDASHLVHLSYGVAVGTIRVDFFHMTPAVQYLTSLDLTLPEGLQKRIRALLCAEFSEKWGNDLDRINTGFVQAHGGDATSGFMIAEWSKAEEVVEDIGLDASSRTDGSWALYNAARTDWLSAERALTRNELANLLLRRVPPQVDTVAAARSAFLRARERLRADHQQTFDGLRGDARLARLRNCLARHEAFIHLHCGSGTLYAFVVQGGNEEIAEHHFYDLNLDAVAAMLHKTRGTPRYADALRVALNVCDPGLGGVLAALSTAGVRNVFVSLPAIIDELPVHIMNPTGDDRPAFAVFESFTYCASAMLLTDRVRRNSLIFTNRVSAVGYGGVDGLVGLGEELERVVDAWHGAEVWLDEAATPARALECIHRSEVVHIACHGYASDRGLGSGLELYDAVRSCGFLTAADLLTARPSQTAASIVVLSSCFGGAHNITRDVVHRFAAIDNVLLRLGVRCVVSSTRALDGDAAVAFSSAFHRYLGAGNTAAGSYRGAMIAVAEQIGATEATPGARRSALEILSSIRLVGDGSVCGPPRS